MYPNPAHADTVLLPIVVAILCSFLALFNLYVLFPYVRSNASKRITGRSGQTGRISVVAFDKIMSYLKIAQITVTVGLIASVLIVSTYA